MKKLLFLFVILTIVKVNAQQRQIPQGVEKKKIGLTGMLIEQPRNQPLAYATVRLLNRRDSSLVQGATSDASGIFTMRNVTVGRYLLHVSFVGFKHTYLPVQMNAEQPVFNIGKVSVSEDAIALREAVVTAQKAEMVVKEDTVEYNADAYKMQESAVAEDLLKRLPGVEVSETGKITVQGKEVKKILVDGKDFFKGDPTMATKNIPVEIMEKLQVIDDKSELAKLTGINDGEEETVINITIKKGMKKGWMVNASGGLGSEFDRLADPLRYDINGFATRMLDDMQIGLVVNGNNINQQRFNSRGGGGGGGGSMRRGMANSGINTSFSSGLTFAEEKGKTFKHGGDITYGYSDKDVQQRSFRQNILSGDSLSFEQDTAKSLSVSQDIQANYKLEWNPTEKWTLQAIPSITYSRSDNENNSRTNTYAGVKDAEGNRPFNEEEWVNRSRKFTTSGSDNLSVNTTLSAARDFDKKGRKLSFSVDASYGLTDTKGTNLSTLDFNPIYGSSASEAFNQRSSAVSNNFSGRAFVSYVEPVGTNNFIQTSYWARYNDRSNVRNTYDFDDATEDYTEKNDKLSKSIANSVLSQQLSASFRAVREKYTLMAGAEFNPSYTRSTRYVQAGNPDGTDKIEQYYPGYTTYNYAPSFDFTYRFSETANLRIEYRARTQAPSIDQLDPTTDVSNPLNIRMGNPDLVPTFSNRLRLRYANFDRKKQQSFMVSLFGNYITNDIVNQTTYLEQGRRETKPINVSGTWNGALMLMANLPLGSMFQINNFTNAGMRNSIGQSVYRTGEVVTSVQDEQALTTSFTENLGVTFRKNWLYMQLRGDYTLSSTQYNIDSKNDLLTHNFGALFSIQANLPLAFAVGSDISYRGVAGYSGGYNQNQTIWNMEVSKSFLKNNAATVRLKVNDILHQQLSILRNVSSNYIEDIEYNTLTSYAMFSLAYRFNSMQGKKGESGGSIDYRRGEGGRPGMPPSPGGFGGRVH